MITSNLKMKLTTKKDMNYKVTFYKDEIILELQLMNCLDTTMSDLKSLTN